MISCNDSDSLDKDDFLIKTYVKKSSIPEAGDGRFFSNDCKAGTIIRVQSIEKDITKAKEINLKLAKLHNSLFVESSPGPVKYAAELLGLCQSETRLPLSPIKEENKKLVFLSMKEAGLIDQ